MKTCKYIQALKPHNLAALRFRPDCGEDAPVGARTVAITGRTLRSPGKAPVGYFYVRASVDGIAGYLLIDYTMA